MPVIKSNAYGHGFFEVAAFCEANQTVKKMLVVSLDEALMLRRKKIKKPIIVLSFFNLEQLKKQKGKNLKNISLPVYDLKTARVLNQIARVKGIKIKIHLKIDTGASRIGFLPAELTKRGNIKTLKSFKNLFIEGIFSHFAASETNKKYTQKQLAIFKEILLKLKDEGIDPPLKHFACTAAALAAPKSRFNAIRLGIGFYGLWASKQAKKAGKFELKPALSWQTRLIQVKKISKNTPVGYGCSCVVNRPTVLGIIPVGYWDGLDRRLSNRGQVLHRGKRCNILGRVCMNMTMIDLTGHRAEAGDKITLIGRQGREEITADEMAEKIGTINYEVISRINPLLPRFFKK